LKNQQAHTRGESMPSYKVVLKEIENAGGTSPVHREFKITADDVDMEDSEYGHALYNFLKYADDESTTTIAAVNYAEVLYITS